MANDLQILKFSTPQAATAAVKRALREKGITCESVRSRRTADARFISCVFMPTSTSDATYAKMAAVLTDAGFRVRLHVDTSWAAASAVAA